MTQLNLNATNQLNSHFFERARTTRHAVLASVMAGALLSLASCGQKQSDPPAAAPNAAATVSTSANGTTPNAPVTPQNPAPSGGSAAPAGANGASAAPPAPPVTIVSVKAVQRDMPVNLKATGAVMPISMVDIRPQATSVIKKVHFREGQYVKAGELLFTLDARADEANVAKARAQLVKDQAALADAKRQLARNKDLQSKNFISQAALDTVQTQVDSAAAVLATDQAAVDVAKVSLSNARISAPSAGRVGSINVFPGSAVQANVTSLVTITQLDPIAISFNLPQRNLPDALQALQGTGASVEATLPDGGGTVSGKLQFVDSAVDANSGSVKVKAVFANKEGKLWPGAFADVSLTVKSVKDAIVIPQAAIVRGARGTIVYVVQDGKAVLRPIQVVQADGADVAVTGIKAGETIVLEGKQNIRPDSKVVEAAPADKPKGRGPGAAGTAGSPGAGAPIDAKASAPTDANPLAKAPAPSGDKSGAKQP